MNDALAGSVVSRSDLSNLAQGIDSEFASLQAKIDARFREVDARFDNVDLKLAHLESRVDARIGSAELKLGGKIETLQWMFGVIVAMNAAVLVQLFLK